MAANKTKGILLAGGNGTRLFPITQVASKQLQPIYNKPMIYYPLTTLMMSGVREILLISTSHDLPNFERLLGDGSQWGLHIDYTEQDEPRGIAEALVIGKNHIGADNVFLMLGDNIIYGDLTFLRTAVQSIQRGEATVCAYQVRNPSAYGIIAFNEHFKGISIEEKPENPISNWAVPGMYLYSSEVVEVAASLDPSARGEYEITDVNRHYLDREKLHVLTLGRGMAWFDAGTPQNLLDVSNFVQAVEMRQGLTIGCPEEAAYNMGFIDSAQFEAAIDRIPKSSYKDTLQRIRKTLAEQPDIRTQRWPMFDG